MIDTNGALRSLEQSSTMVKGRIMLLENDVRQLDYQLRQARKRERDMEEALFKETLEKIVYRKKSDTSLVFMMFSVGIAFGTMVLYYLF